MYIILKLLPTFIAQLRVCKMYEQYRVIFLSLNTLYTLCTPSMFDFRFNKTVVLLKNYFLIYSRYYMIL